MISEKYTLDHGIERRTFWLGRSFYSSADVGRVHTGQCI
jgi:hypothetical protein